MEAPDENGLDEFIVEIMEKEEKISFLKKEKNAVQLLLDETKTELGRCQTELMEAKNMATRLNQKMEQYVKETMRLSPINDHLQKPNLIEAVAGKLTAKEKGKKIENEQICLDDVSSDESIDWDEAEDSKRRMRAHRDVPPPKTYWRSRRPPWNVNYPVKKPSQPWKRVEGSSRQFAYSKANQTRVQYGNETDNRKLRPAQYGRRNHKLNSTQFVKHQYRRREETSRQFQHQKSSQHVWRHHSFQRQPQFRRDYHQTDLYQRFFTRKRPEKNEEMKKKERKVVPKGAKMKNEDRASSSQQRRNISSSSSRVIRQIWVPKGTTNQQGPKC